MAEILPEFMKQLEGNPAAQAAVLQQSWLLEQCMRIGNIKVAAILSKDITRAFLANAQQPPQRVEMSVSAPMFEQSADAIRARLATLRAAQEPSPGAAPAPPVGDSTLPSTSPPPGDKNPPEAK